MQIKYGTLIDACDGYKTITKYSGDSVYVIKTKENIYANWPRTREIIMNAPKDLPEGWVIEAKQEGDTASTF